MKQDDVTELGPEEEDELLYTAHTELREKLGYQIETIGNISNKALRTVNIQIILLGVFVTGVSASVITPVADIQASMSAGDDSWMVGLLFLVSAGFLFLYSFSRSFDASTFTTVDTGPEPEEFRKELKQVREPVSAKDRSSFVQYLVEDYQVLVEENDDLIHRDARNLHQSHKWLSISLTLLLFGLVLIQPGVMLELPVFN